MVIAPKCICKLLFSDFTDLSVTAEQYMLLGYLKDAKTLKKVFGYKPEVSVQAKYESKDDLFGSDEVIPMWQYDGCDLVPLDLPGVLNYYKEYFEKV